LVLPPRKFPSLIDFQIVTKDKQIFKIVLENVKLGQQYKTIIFRNLVQKDCIQTLKINGSGPKLLPNLKIGFMAMI